MYPSKIIIQAGRLFRLKFIDDKGNLNKLIFPVIIVISSYPASLNSNDPFEVEIEIKGARKGTNYIKLEIYKDGTNSSFGETFNNKDWYNGSDPFSYPSVNIDSPNTSTRIKGRLGENFPESGIYKLSVKRFTSSGLLAKDTQSPVDIKIEYKSDTPTPSPSPSVSQSPPITTIPITPEASKKRSPTKILSASASPQQTTPPPLTKQTLVNSEKSFPLVPAIIFATGLFLIGFGIFLLYNRLNAQENS